MNNRNSKKKIYSIYGIIALGLMTTVIPAFGKKQWKDFILSEMRYEDRYEMRNAEITPWVEDGTGPKQGNAALLYYQAFLLMPEFPKSISNEIHGANFNGIVPDKQVRRYLGSCLDVIEIVETASRMQQCTWNVWVKPVFPQPVFPRSLGVLRDRFISIYDILFLDALTLAADRHYRVALERCLTALRIVRHFRQDPELFMFSTAFEQIALRMVRYVLGVIPPDEEILTWFGSRLGIILWERPLFAERLQKIVNDDLKHLRTYPTQLAKLRNLIIEETEDELVKEKARNLADEQLLLYTSKGFQNCLDSIFRILESEITYKQKRAEMQKIISKLTKADDADPVIKYGLLDYNIGGIINNLYPTFVEHQAYINGIKAAVEIYLNVAKTGQLPKTLPDGLPKDPSTGKDFIYEIMNDGFALRCHDEEFLSRLDQRLEFKVKK